MKAYCVGGPMDMQVMLARDEQHTISFATTPMLPLPRYEDMYGPPIEVTQVVYRMVYKSQDGKLAVYVAEEAL